MIWYIMHRILYIKNNNLDISFYQDRHVIKNVTINRFNVPNNMTHTY